ncbi:MAG: hypothetical protein AAFY56_08420 [Pseudomonadota bacterium]
MISIWADAFMTASRSTPILKPHRGEVVVSERLRRLWAFLTNWAG